MRFRKTAILAAAMMLLTGTAVMTTGCGSKKVFDTSTMTDNQFLVTLYPEFAPATVENFEGLVKKGFYNGLIFHRIVDGFMAQGGDPTGTGMGGSDNEIKGEFSTNGFTKNTLSHTRGVVSMARSMDPDSASSQFFICYSDDDTFLDGQYAAFGKVTAGMEVVDSFLKIERAAGSDGAMSSPVTPITIQTAVMVDGDAEGHPQALITMEDFLTNGKLIDESDVEEGGAQD